MILARVFALATKKRIVFNTVALLFFTAGHLRQHNVFLFRRRLSRNLFYISAPILIIVQNTSISLQHIRLLFNPL